MELKNIVLHQIIKEVHGDPTLNLSHRLLVIDEITIEFVKTLVKSYISKSPTYGTFDEDRVNNPFQTSVKNYFQNHDFLTFSKESMNTLKKAISKPQTKGGYVVFIHYKEKTEDFIVTVMLDNSTQFTVDTNNLDIKRLLGLDIEKVARANRINWKQWNNDKESYLSFIKGTRGVSDYFAKDFIGCTDYKSARKNAKQLEKAINHYMNENNFDNDRKQETRKKLKEYTDQQIKNEQDIMINSIAAYIDPANPDNFVNYINQNELEVGNFRSTNLNDFKGFKIKTVAGKDYKLEYQRNADDIIPDKKNRQIIIKNIPIESFED